MLCRFEKGTESEAKLLLERAVNLMRIDDSGIDNDDVPNEVIKKIYIPFV